MYQVRVSYYLFSDESDPDNNPTIDLVLGPVTIPCIRNQIIGLRLEFLISYISSMVFYKVHCPDVKYYFLISGLSSGVSN